MTRPRTIVFTTTGSHGDLHPMLAVAVELHRRGHRVIQATDRAYQKKIESMGVTFELLRPGLEDMSGHGDFYAQINHPTRGSEFIVRKLVLPWIERSAEDLEIAFQGADLVVSHPITYAAPVVAERMGIRWAAVALQPMVFFSAFDPPFLPPVPWLNRLRFLGPRFHAPLFALINRVTRHWMRPVDQLRARWNLPPARGNPLLEGQFSPDLNLALFSSVLASPQPDWPANTVITGFPRLADPEMDPVEADRLEVFLAAGPPPIVFTLGTTAVNAAGDFFRVSLAAAAALGVRAILLVGRDPRNQPTEALPETVLALQYVPFAVLLPRAAVTVHQGGVGTTGQALSSGRPQVVVPWANDQPDNAARIKRLGVGLVLSRHNYTVASVSGILRRILGSTAIAAKAKEVGERMRREDGSVAAADAIEAFLDRP